jgi:hypothetical protein
MKTPKEQNGAKLLQFGKLCMEMKRDLSSQSYQQWKKGQSQLWHEAYPGRVLADMDSRYIRLARMQVLWDHIDKLPCTGIATLRELSKLGEDKLRHLFEIGLIDRQTTRQHIDGFRALELPKNKIVAARHP